MASTYGVFPGLDVGKRRAPRRGPGPDRKTAARRAAANSEPKLPAVFDKLAAHGPVLVVVEQPATIGALPVAVARACGHQVAHLPGLAMRRIADLHSGKAKTDARNALLIADVTRIPPHTLRQVDVGNDALDELGALVGSDDELAAEATRISNRIRGLLTGIRPALERALGPRVTHAAVLKIRARCGGPIGLANISRRKLVSIATKHAPRMGARLVDELQAALAEQTVVVPDAATADMVLPRLAEGLKPHWINEKRPLPRLREHSIHTLSPRS
ncbi:IS110 family transposase [Saccharopolyspora hirsuta]|uniref:IS110 family transposase n=1 Tax=Saccharopolyspora hirsuta TaxID=1837 RepID=UPI003318B490